MVSEFWIFESKIVFYNPKVKERLKRINELYDDSFALSYGFLFKRRSSSHE